MKNQNKDKRNMSTKNMSYKVRPDLAVLMDPCLVVGKLKPTDNSEIMLVLECNLECEYLMFYM